MIKLNKINKFYNKNKLNEIHVIDNTSIEFPEVGLVAITGPSGCGKTTLLNIIGGLDNFESGEIQFEENVISHYHPYVWDKIRNKYVGYIFQNYNLIIDKTVYENVEIALNMSGLYDKNEINERINYVLKTVGMYNYRRRNVQALSGGQQQRVAIARAIAKNPKVVLADEPTGNLDANNTFEIMSIIKKISQTCLVILVSHEKELVDFYADRVIELSDGKIINDYEHAGNRSLRHIDERDIYLKDLIKDDSLVEHNIERYYDEEKDNSLSMQIIELRDSIYIKAKGTKKIKYLTPDTEINLIDDHYKEKQTDDINEYEFDLNQFGEIKASQNRLSFIKFWSSLKNGFIKTLTRRKFIGRLFILVYFVVSAIVALQLATFGNMTNADPKDFLNVSRNLISIDVNDTDKTINGSFVNDILKDTDNIEFSYYLKSAQATFALTEYYQGVTNVSISVYPIKESWANESDLIVGRMPADNTEVVIDKWIADEILENKQITDLNITDINDLVGYYLRSIDQGALPFKIVGIIDTDSPIIVLDDDAILGFIESSIYNTRLNYFPYGVAKGRVEITEGRGIQNNNEILIGENSDASTSYNVGDQILINGTSFEIVGKFIYPNDYPGNMSYYDIIVPNSLIEEQYLNILNLNQFEFSYYGTEEKGLYFFSDNMQKAIQDLQTNGYTAYSAFEYQQDIYHSQQLRDFQSNIRAVLIVLGGIVIYIFFMMRSSMLNRIKEIGIYRSIGASKLDIYKIFFGEILAFTTIGSLTGYVTMSILIWRVEAALGDIISTFYFPIYYFLGGIIAIYLINVIFGMLPIFTLLRKTPSEINSKYDI